MTKGLARSISRGPKSRAPIVKQTVRVSTTVTVTSVTTAVGFGTTVVGDLPEGNILFLGAAGYLAFAGSGDDANLTATWNGDFSLGSAPTVDVTLSGAEVDLLPSTAIGPAVAEVAPVARSVNATQVMLDNTDNSLELNLNVLIDAADIGDSQSVILTVTGTIELAYIVLLDD
jgi:hypothetical protein